MTEPPRLLGISISALGDTVMCLPALDALRRSYPNAQIGFLVRPEFKDLFGGQPSVDVVLGAAVPSAKTIEGLRKLVDLARVVRNFKPDAAFLFVGTPRYVELILRLSGAKKIYRVPNYTGIRWLLTNRKLSAENDWDTTKHGIEDRLRAVRLFGVRATLTPMQLSVSGAWVSEAMEWLKAREWTNQRIVVLQVGASSIRRRWPQDRFAALACRLVTEFSNARCVITGSLHELAYCRQVVDFANDDRVATSAGELSLCGLAGLISLSSLLVTPDTGTMHLGHAVGVNSVCLYTFSDVQRTQALDDGYLHTIIQRRPLPTTKLSPEQMDSCMSLLSLEDVYDVCSDVLRRTAPS